jgi:hypothetical protein
MSHHQQKFHHASFKACAKIAPNGPLSDLCKLTARIRPFWRDDMPTPAFRCGKRGFLEQTDRLTAFILCSAQLRGQPSGLPKVANSFAFGIG